MPRILFVLTGTGRGGAETQVVSLATRFVRNGYEVGLVSLLPTSDFVPELQQGGVQVFSLGMERGKPSIRALVRFIGIIHQYHPDIIHSHMVHANLMARIAKLFHKIPLINTAHSINEGGRARELAYRFTDRLCDRFTIISEAAADRYVRVGAAPAGHILTVPNGVDTVAFQHDSNVRSHLRSELGVASNFVWLAVGRFEVVKGYEYMLRAFAALVRKSPATSLLIAGTGPLFEPSVALAGELGIAANVHFLGLRKDVRRLMSAADAFVMSSLHEGLPMVLLESASCGLPAVATDVGGNREVIVQDKTGLLVAPRDADALMSGMARLMEMSPQSRSEIGSVARKHVVAKYSLENIVHRWEMLYSKLLSNL